MRNFEKPVAHLLECVKADLGLYRYGDPDRKTTDEDLVDAVEGLFLVVEQLAKKAGLC